MAVTSDIILEYEEVLQLKYGIKTATSFIKLLRELPNVHLFYPFYKWQLITADLDDNKYCDCAIAGQATYIVTEDRHFDALKNVPFPQLAAVSIDQFLEILG